MACFNGVLPDSYLNVQSAVTRTVRPEGAVPLAAWQCERIELLAFERLFARMPLEFASYPALVFRLKDALPEVLQRSLAVVLKAQPQLAGRLCGTAVALTNDGVPFTVVQDVRPSAPHNFEERDLLYFSDFRSPQRVAVGLEPLLTFKLTCFRDGSAVLGFCRTHALLDGSSAWSFLASWAKTARSEESAKHGSSERQPLRDLLPDDAELQPLALEVLGSEMKATWASMAQGVTFPVMARVFDTLFFLNLKGLGRPRVFFSDDELARIKDAATPREGAAGDGWVSTQEAIAAYLLVNLAKELLPPTSDGSAMLVFLLDARKALGLEPDHSFGVGMTFFQVPLEGLLQRSLADVAGCIHDAMRGSTDKVRNLWRVLAGANERGLGFSAFADSRRKLQDYDLVLQLNNQSKRVLPDFGRASGGPAQSVLTNAGPSLILPAPGGVNLFLNPEVFKSAPARVRARALARLRSELPPAREVAASPSKVAVSPSKVAPSPSKVAASPGKVSASQFRVVRSGGA